MEVALGVLFLPCPLDLNGTKSSRKDEERRGEGKRRGKEGVPWLGAAAILCTRGPSSNTLAGKLRFDLSTPYTMKLL